MIEWVKELRVTMNKKYNRKNERMRDNMKEKKLCTCLSIQLVLSYFGHLRPVMERFVACAAFGMVYVYLTEIKVTKNH